MSEAKYLNQTYDEERALYALRNATVEGCTFAGPADGEAVRKECRDIRVMAEATIKMVTDSVDAYVRQDLSLARAVIEYDDVVDEAFCRVKRTLIAMIAQNTADGEYALDLLMIAKYFERIGDHAVNIAEWVEFSVTGEHKSDSMQ